MSEFKPVSTRQDLLNLDTNDIVDGYWHGFYGNPEPGSDKSRSFWHGWRNGMVDSKRMEMDCHMRQLAMEICRMQKAH